MARKATQRVSAEGLHPKPCKMLKNYTAKLVREYDDDDDEIVRCIPGKRFPTCEEYGKRVHKRGKDHFSVLEQSIFII